LYDLDSNIYWDIFWNLILQIEVKTKCLGSIFKCQPYFLCQQEMNILKTTIEFDKEASSFSMQRLLKISLHIICNYEFLSFIIKKNWARIQVQSRKRVDMWYICDKDNLQTKTHIAFYIL